MRCRLLSTYRSFNDCFKRILTSFATAENAALGITGSIRRFFGHAIAFFVSPGRLVRAICASCSRLFFRSSRCSMSVGWRVAARDCNVGCIKFWCCFGTAVRGSIDTRRDVEGCMTGGSKGYLTQTVFIHVVDKYSKSRGHNKYQLWSVSIGAQFSCLLHALIQSMLFP